MDNTHGDTHLIDTHEEHNREGAEEEGFFEDANENTTTEEELENMHLDLDHNFLSPIMNPGLITAHNIDPEKLIGDPGYFCQYCS